MMGDCLNLIGRGAVAPAGRADLVSVARRRRCVMRCVRTVSGEGRRAAQGCSGRSAHHAAPFS